MRRIAPLAFAVLASLAACAPAKAPEAPAPAAPPARPAPVGLTNPAAVACVDSGGSLVSYDTPEGVVSYCKLPDGRQCEEWALFRDKTCETPPPGVKPQSDQPH